MKKVAKLLSGVLLASALFAGCSANGNVNFHSTETVETTDANGNTTTTTTTNVNGQTETTTTKACSKDTYFVNQSNITFTKLRAKYSGDDEYTDMLNGETLEPGTYYKYESVSYNEDRKTMDLQIEDENGEPVTFSNVDITNVKDLKEVKFVFTTENGAVYVGVSD